MKMSELIEAVKESMDDDFSRMVTDVLKAAHRAQGAPNAAEMLRPALDTVYSFDSDEPLVDSQEEL